MNPKKPKDIRRSSSMNQGEFGYSPEDLLSEQEMIDFVKNIDFDESKRIVQAPIEVTLSHPPVGIPEFKVDGKVIESVTFHPHKNPLMFTIDFESLGGKPD